MVVWDRRFIDGISYKQYFQMSLNHQRPNKLRINSDLNFSEPHDRKLILKLVAERAKLKSLEAEELIR